MLCLEPWKETERARLQTQRRQAALPVLTVACWTASPLSRQALHHEQLCPRLLSPSRWIRLPFASTESAKARACDTASPLTRPIDPIPTTMSSIPHVAGATGSPCAKFRGPTNIARQPSGLGITNAIATVTVPVTARPVTALPVAARPVTALPVAARPVTALSVTARPLTALPVTAFA